MREKKVCIVFGTRPEAIKLYPVIRELKKEQFNVITIFSGQHRDLIKDVTAILDISITRDLKVMKPDQTLPELTSRLHVGLSDAFESIEPDIVIVQGDTHTAFITALESYYHKIPVAHVEAGLRTGDIYNPFPEEMSRRLITQIATYHFAPTEHAHWNLWQDGVEQDDNILVTGNTGIDTLLEVAKDIDVETEKTILVTLHRRESFGVPMVRMFGAIKEMAKKYPDYRFLYPVHPNPNVKTLAYDMLSKTENIILSDPFDYKTMVRALKQCYFVVTDSGGLQEEAPALHKPVLVLRDETERPEGIDA